MNRKHYTVIVVVIVTTLLLTLLYNMTSPMIAQHKTAKEHRTIAALLNEDETIVKKQNFELLAPPYLNMGDTQQAIRIYNPEGATAIVFKSLTKGYNGYLALVFSLDKSCTVNAVEILSEHETPGLGDQYKHNENAWLKQFSGKNRHNATFSLTRAGGDFDAWSGATVTPQAIVRAVKLAVDLCHDAGTQLFSDAEVVYAE